MDVFVSYARVDRERAETVMAALREEHFVVWWDLEIRVGEDFRTALDTMLDATRAVVVLWSHASVNARWVREEADHAQERGKLIPACIDDVRPPIGFRSTQFALLTGFNGDRQHPEFRKLCAAIRQLIDNTSAPEDARQHESQAGTGVEHVTVAAPVLGPQLRPPETRRGTRRRTWLLFGAAVVVLMAAALLISDGDDITIGSDGLPYRRIHAGRFIMGCDHCEPDEWPAHAVNITSDFWITETEVTVDAYHRFARATGRAMPPQTGRREANPAEFNPQWRDGRHPIVNVSHDDATQYCRRAGGRFPWSRGDLPTEAQWEYAARGGTTGLSFPWGNEISRERANYGYKDPTTGRIHPRASERGARDRWLFTSPVGSFDPNGYGLYDMVGNVQEWARDAFRPYDVAQVNDPVAVPFQPSDERVVRGGSFLYDQDDSRVENRSKNPPGERYPDTGFRCVFPARNLW